jgi:hypothetical protein
VVEINPTVASIIHSQKHSVIMRIYQGMDRDYRKKHVSRPCSPGLSFKSGDLRQKFLVDSMAEDIITALSPLSATSAMATAKAILSSSRVAVPPAHNDGTKILYQCISRSDNGICG